MRLTARMTVLLSFVCVHLATGLSVAQQAAAPPRALTASDYRRAESFMNYSVAPLVLRGAVRPTWLDGDRFWFRNTTEQGNEFVLVDAATGSRRPAFDHEKLAAALSDAAGTRYESRRLPFQTFEFSPDGRSISLNVARRRFTCDVEGATCVAEAPDQAPPQASAPPGPPVRTDVLSPDRRLAAFIRNDNLWVRDVATRQEIQLTTDGVKDYGYATDNAGWRRSAAPIVAWSPDSKKIATFRQDQRGVGEMYLVETRVGRPILQAWKYPLPGDATVATIERVIVHVDGPRLVPFKMAPDQHRSTICDDLACRGEWGDVQWSPDSTRLAFASVSRDHKEVVLREADAATGAVRDVLEEKVKTLFESGNGRVSWRYLPASSEVIWFSQRDNWGHLYLYDLRTGQLKHRITTGEGNVAQLLYVDEKSRTLLFVGNGREPGRDPYFRHVYRVGLDGQRLALLTPEDADHEVSVSRSGRFFTDSYSTPDVPPVSVVRDLTGRAVATIEKADISKLLATGWKPPMRITVKARDGVTDLYGLLFRPTSFDPSRKYPIVNNIYPGPQQGSVGSRSFSAVRGDTQALAELGFVVVQIDAMGTPGRSKAFHDAYYGNMGDNGLPDQVAGMKELAARFPWIDLDRAGIYGHSGGGYAAAGAMFRYPDFFKVGVSQAGNHDNRNYEDDWGEKWQGLLQASSDGTTNYDNQANQLVAKNLKGRLLLAHGTLDNNVPPSNTLLVVDELIKANKDFDLILFPNRTHGFGSEPYMVRRRWDYFVRHLLGAEPPREYELKPSGGPQAPTP